MQRGDGGGGSFPQTHFFNYPNTFPCLIFMEGVELKENARNIKSCIYRTPLIEELFRRSF